MGTSQNIILKRVFVMFPNKSSMQMFAFLKKHIKKLVSSISQTFFLCGFLLQMFIKIVSRVIQL